MAMQSFNFKKKPAVLEQVGFSHATLYLKIRTGRFVPPIKVGRMSLWIDCEVDTVCKAHAAGYSDDELKRLVAELVANRKSFVQ